LHILCELFGNDMGAGSGLPRYSDGEPESSFSEIGLTRLIDRKLRGDKGDAFLETELRIHGNALRHD
jgi:hypothetical protein